MNQIDKTKEKIKNYASWIFGDPLNKENVLFALSALVQEVVTDSDDIKNIITLVDAKIVIDFLRDMKEEDYIKKLKENGNYILDVDNENKFTLKDYHNFEEILLNLKLELDKHFKKRGR